MPGRVGDENLASFEIVTDGMLFAPVYRNVFRNDINVGDDKEAVSAWLAIAIEGKLVRSSASNLVSFHGQKLGLSMALCSILQETVCRAGRDLVSQIACETVAFQFKKLSSY